MKIYLSGKISGLPIEEARQRFDDAEALLDCIGFDVVNPMKKDLPDYAPWKEHIVMDIAMLLECDAIYMMDNWCDSLGATIEYDIATRLGLDMWFESDVRERNSTVVTVQKAIRDVLGMRFNEYVTKSRKRDYVYARMIFIYHCRKSGHMALSQISKYLHRDHSSILYLLKKHDDEMKYNSEFRQKAARVDEALKGKFADAARPEDFKD